MMGLVLPFCAFLCGVLCARKYLNLTLYLKKILSSLLARLFIPIVIIYNMVFYQPGSLWLIGFSLFSSLILFSLYYYLQHNKLNALCFSYLNGAWLGFPLALAVFGTQASSIIVALYIGGSVFGNVCAALVLSEYQQSVAAIIKNILQSPPVIALILAGLLSCYGLVPFQTHPAIQMLYQLDKILVTFSGMCILGMWLSHVTVTWADLQYSLKIVGHRMLYALLLCSLAYLLLPIPRELLTYAVIMMFFCLPPAANIVALETHYQGTGYSANIIASGTIVSVIVILCYAILWQLVSKTSVF